MQHHLEIPRSAVIRFVRPAGLLLLALLLTAGPSSAYIVVLKDGTQITTAKKYELQGENVILTLPNDVSASYLASDIDFEKTDELNRNSNLSNARILETGNVRALESRQRTPEPDRQTFTGLLSNRGTGLALPEPRKRVRGSAEAAAEVPTTTAGFVDLMSLRREPLEQDDQVTEIIGYLNGQGNEAKVYKGSRKNWPLVEMTAASEASVFKVLKDAASCLVQMRQQFQQLEGFELLLLTETQGRAGQFSLTPEQANELLTGRTEPPTFFLRYVEF